MVSEGNCKHCKKYFKDGRARHEKTCKKNPNREQEKPAKTYKECNRCKKQILLASWSKHRYCSICKRCFTVDLPSFNTHLAKHATPGLFFSAKLEQLFDDNKLKTGKKLIEEIKEHFKDRQAREKSHFYLYLILAVFKDGWLSFEDFCSAIIYVGRGQGIRIVKHNLGVEEMNDDLRAFFEECHAEGKQPTAFIPFTRLLDKEADAYETTIVRALDPSNTTNKAFGSMPAGFDYWDSDDVAETGARFLYDAYEIYLDTQFASEKKINSKTLFDSPAKWFITLKKSELTEKASYTIKELKKRPNSDARYTEVPSNVSDDQFFALMKSGDARLLALLSEDNVEPPEKRARQE